MTIDSPKGPEGDLRERVAERLASWGIAYVPQRSDDPIYDRLADRVVEDVVAPEVERLTAEVERLRAQFEEAESGRTYALNEQMDVVLALGWGYHDEIEWDAVVDAVRDGASARQQLALAYDDARSLREQLATSVVVPQDAEDQLRIAIADPGSRLPRIHYTPERASEPVTRWSARSVLDLLASWAAPVSESVPATPTDFGCLRIDLVSEWKRGDKALFRLHPDDEGEEVEVRKVVGSTALVETDPFPFGNPQRWSADISELSPLPAPAPRCTAIVPTGPEDAMECGGDPVEGTERCDGHTQADPLRASAPSEASQVRHVVRVTKLLGLGRSVVVCTACRDGMTGSDQEAEDWKAKHLGGLSRCVVCGEPGDEHETRQWCMSDQYVDGTWPSSPPSGGDSDTTPRVWAVGDRVHRPAWNWTGLVRAATPEVNRYRVQWDHMLDKPLSEGSSMCTSEELTEVPFPSSLPQERGTDT